MSIVNGEQLLPTTVSSINLRTPADKAHEVRLPPCVCSGACGLLILTIRCFDSVMHTCHGLSSCLSAVHPSGIRKERARGAKSGRGVRIEQAQCSALMQDPRPRASVRAYISPHPCTDEPVAGRSPPPSRPLPPWLRGNRRCPSSSKRVWAVYRDQTMECPGPRPWGSSH